ncbi:Os01g0626500 [Oryza sativa Japonica Group]|uniref:Os01g0626500 protein n=1 Tax=Oryza sativa subsp. japonica TaxID=39947 RepID=Q0JL35_ORYSJ|nr:hypothetical protein OsJ_02675 [Oryza sativa Japonica Group]BAF05543.1 Os01g0626500 [Oryza sativa Japonica Group]|eukprot:NP_001043629.1 Os01g0626500 [Oryza sativa Japonica Group]
MSGGAWLDFRVMWVLHKQWQSSYFFLATRWRRSCLPSPSRSLDAASHLPLVSDFCRSLDAASHLPLVSDFRLYSPQKFEVFVLCGVLPTRCSLFSLQAWECGNLT